MIVHRILDVVFRTLDTIDAVRAKVATTLGHEPQPPSQWPPVVDAPPASSPPVARTVDLDTVKDSYTEPPDLDDYVAKAPEKKQTKQEDEAVTAPSAPAAKKKAAATKPKKKKATAESKKPAASTRKGSVDRKGEDFDSPRARAVATFLIESGTKIIHDDAALDGKKTLARVLWAVGCADAAGSEHGLTAADASALLSSVAGLEVFSTNVARAFRDEPTLFAETVPDGRSKRYKLTAAGRARLSEVATR